MSTEIATATLVTEDDLHQAVAEVLPRPETLPTDSTTQPGLETPDFSDTPFLASILAEAAARKAPYTVAAQLPEIMGTAARERAVYMGNVRQETPLFAATIAGYTSVAAERIARFTEIAKSEAAPAASIIPTPRQQPKAESFGWFEAPSTQPEQQKPSDTPPAPPTQPLPRPVRPSQNAIWRFPEADRLAEPGTETSWVTPRLPNAAQPKVLPEAPKPQPVKTFLQTIRTKVTKGWRRITSKSPVPALPNW